MTMQVASISHQDGAARLPSVVAPHRDDANVKTEAQGVDVPTVDPAPAEGVRPEETVEGAEESRHLRKAPGVLRLLEAGHFKGVADVRLRINFFDELSAAAGERAQAATGEESAKLLDAVTTGVDGLLSAMDVDQETRAQAGSAVAEFEAGVAEVVEEFTSQSSNNLESMASGIHSAFDALISTLVDMLSEPDEVPAPVPPSDSDDPTGTAPETPPEAAPEAAGTEVAAIDATPLPTDVGKIADAVADVEEAPEAPLTPPSEEEPVAPNEPTAGPTLDELIASLVESFEESLASFVATITEAGSRGEPSPPSGNGVAYDKFMEIYNELRGHSAAVDDVV
jgi:hypothetical protein